MTHSDMCFTSRLSFSLPPITHTNFSLSTQAGTAQQSQAHFSIYIKVCFTSFPQTFFFPCRSKIQLHSRCANHISQLDTLKPTQTLEFSPKHTCTRLILLHMSTCCNELRNKYPVESHRTHNPDANRGRYKHAVQTITAMDVGRYTSNDLPRNLPDFK